MTARQRKILVIGFVIGSVLAAAVDIASACPKGVKSRSSSGRSGLYAQNRPTNHSQDATLFARGRAHKNQLPPATMVVEEYQLVSTTPAMAPPVFTSSVITTATEVHERQRRKSAALEESWKQDDAVRPAGFTAAQFDVVKN